MKKQTNMMLPVTIKTSSCNLDTIEPTWNITITLGDIKLIEYTYYGKSEKIAIQVAKEVLKERLV